jgi:hypothetical protein
MLSLSTHTLSIIAGTGAISDTGDGGSPTSATFKFPYSIWGDSDGLFLFIADPNANKIRVIDKSLDIIYTAAGTGTGYPSGPDGLPATSTNIFSPYGVWGNTAGNIFIAEYFGYNARKLYLAPPTFAPSIFPSSPSEVPSVIPSAPSEVPSAVPSVIASAVPPSYLVATVAGDGSWGSSAGDGGQATSASIYGPIGVWQDSVGTLFIAEEYGNRVRAVLSSGIISTVAGNGTQSSSSTDPNGDNGPVRLLS